jgi:hypothetical protein
VEEIVMTGFSDVDETASTVTQRSDDELNGCTSPFTMQRTLDNLDDLPADVPEQPPLLQQPPLPSEGKGTLNENSHHKALQAEEQMQQMRQPQVVGGRMGADGTVWDRLASENASLLMENMMLTQQCLAAACAAQMMVTAPPTMSSAESEIKPVDGFPAAVAQHAQIAAAQYEQALRLWGVAQKAFVTPMQSGLLGQQGTMNAAHPITGQLSQPGPPLEQWRTPPQPSPSQPHKAGRKPGNGTRMYDSQQNGVAEMGPMAKARGHPAAPSGDSESCIGSHHAAPSSGSVKSDLTTVMLRNLPNQYTRAMLLDLLDSQSFAGLYDFVNLPIDFASRSCLGYAFVNLITNEVASAFCSKLQGFGDWIIPSRKICSVTWSGPHQGLQAHIERYQNSPVMHDLVPDVYKPIILKDGVRIPFPPPTRKLKAPRPLPSFAGSERP